MQISLSLIICSITVILPLWGDYILPCQLLWGSVLSHPPQSPIGSVLWKLGATARQLPMLNKLRYAPIGQYSENILKCCISKKKSCWYSLPARISSSNGCYWPMSTLDLSMDLQCLRCPSYDPFIVQLCVHYEWNITWPVFGMFHRTWFSMICLVNQGPFSVSCSAKAQIMLSQSQARLLKLPVLWLAEHSLNLLLARDRKPALVWWMRLPLWLFYDFLYWFEIW